MPLYEYRCENGHTFEVMQRMSDDPVSACTICGAPVQRVFHPVAVHFKGSGFYTTDYGRKKGSGRAGASEDGAAPSDSGSKKDTDKAGSAAKSGSGSSSGSGGSDSSGSSGSSGSKGSSGSSGSGSGE
jgi:putative FmdB family regulatory protein